MIAPDKQARLFGGDHQREGVTFQALKERRSNVLERRTSHAERKKSQMETLKGPPPSGIGNGNGTAPSVQSRARGKAPKPKVTNINFTNQVIVPSL